MNMPPHESSNPLIQTGSQLPANQAWMPPSNMWLEPPAEEEGLNLGAFVHSLRRKWLPASLIGLVLASIVATVLFIFVPITYEAVGLLRVSFENNEMMEKAGRRFMDTQTFAVYKQTQAQLITSPFVLNASLRELETKNVEMLANEENKLAWLQKELDASFPGKSEILRLALSGENSEEVKTVVQSVLEAYLEEIANTERGERSRRLQNLREKERGYRNEMKERLEKVETLAKEIGTSDSELAKINQQIEMDRYRQLDRKMMQLRTEAEQLNAQLILAQSMAQNTQVKPHPYDIEMLLERDAEYMEAKQILEYMDQQMSAVQGTVRRGGTLNRIAAERAQYEKAMNDRRRELVPRLEHVLMRDLYKKDETIEGQNIAGLQTQLNVTGQLYKQAAEEVKQQQTRLQELSGFSSELEAEKSQLEALDETTADLSKEIANLEINLNSPPRITMVQPAIIPSYNSLWFKMFQMACAWLATFLATVLGVTVLDYAAKKMNDGKDLEKSMGLPVIGTLPAVRAGISLFGGGNSEAMIANSVDSIRAAIAYGGSNTKSVVVTSAVGQEGKSTVASQLAVSLARAGLRTVLVDGDIRKPSQHAVFGLAADHGLSEVLRSQAELQSVVQATPAENLWILPAGRCDKVSFQAMAGPALTSLVDELKQQFDFIVVDAGPVLTGPEALIFGQCVDGAVISSRRDVSQLPQVEEAYRRLQSVGIRVIGAVVNGVQSETRTSLVPV